MEKFIRQLAQEHFEADRQAFINFIRKSFRLNGDEITDIYNEVWIDVIDNIRRGRTEHVRNWKSYVFDIGRKKACKLVTRRTEMERIEDEEGYSHDFQMICLETIESDNWQIAYLEQIEMLLTELQRMPERQREVLEHFYIDGMSMAEIASLMGYRGPRSVITVKQRSVEHLQKRMKSVA